MTSIFSLSMRIVLMISSLLIYSEATATQEENLTDAYPAYSCYRFSKEDFLFPVGGADDFTVSYDVNQIDPEPLSAFLNFKLQNRKELPSAYVQCYIENSSGEVQQCDGYNNESLQVFIQDDAMHLHIDHMQFSAKDSPLIETLRSKSSSYAVGTKVPCKRHSKPLIKVPDLVKGSKREKLLHSIKTEDIILYDLAYYHDFAIAVGEENTLESRELKYQNGDYLFTSVILRTTDGGASWERLERDSEYAYAPGNKLLVLDDRHIIIASTGEEEFYGTLTVSTDGASTWKSVSENVGTIVSLERVNDTVTAIDENHLILISTDKGEHWHTISSLAKKEDEADIGKPATPFSSPGMLQPPSFLIDYAHNGLIVRHAASQCSCDRFTLPLLYYQHNHTKGILGYGWSLGIEDHIESIDQDTLLFFNAKRGKTFLYKRDRHDRHTFMHPTQGKIVKNADGYTITCQKAIYRFTPKGRLGSIRYPERSYRFHYEKNRLIKIEEATGNRTMPYLTFTYTENDTGIMFHPTKETVHFLKQDDLLTTVIKGNHRMYAYRYTEKRELESVYTYPERGAAKLLYEMRYVSQGKYKNKLFITDHRRKNTQTVTSTQYLIPKETNTVVSYRTSNNPDADHPDLYTFRYYDASKKHLAFTQFNLTQYGYDTEGRVNFYGKGDYTISVTYDSYNKLTDSVIEEGNKRSVFHYGYTEESQHLLNTIISPTEHIGLSYNEKGSVTRMKSKAYTMLYRYNSENRLTKIILKDRGELEITYGPDGTPKETKAILYDKSLDESSLALYITRAMDTLKNTLKAGTIQQTPQWVW